MVRIILFYWVNLSSFALHWRFCSSLLPTLLFPPSPFPCTRVCFPHCTAISPLSPCSVPAALTAAFGLQFHSAFWNPTTHPLQSAQPAFLLPVFRNLVISGLAGNEKLGSGPGTTRTSLLNYNWGNFRLDEPKQKANNYPVRCCSSPFHNTMAHKRRWFSKNLLQRYLSSKRTSYRSAVRDFYTSQLRVSQHPVTSFWYGMKGNWITSDLHDLLKPNRKWAAVSAANPELTPCSASPTQSLFLPVG